MKSPLKSILASAAVATVALGAAASASAQDYYGFHRHDRYERYARQEWRDACRAGRWNPQVRYMPGEVVRRHGELYMARRVSARVWNVNSPPEWTPNYWVPARCD